MVRTLGRNEENRREMLFLHWRRKDSKQRRGGKEEEQNEEKIEAESLGCRLRQSNENSDFGRLKSDCELDEWEMDDQQSKNQDESTKDAEHAGQA